MTISTLRKTVFIPTTLIISLFILSVGALADPVETVTNTNDMGAGSLRQAILDVNPGGTVNFNIPGAGPHTIGLMSEIAINKPMTINGPGAAVVTIDAQMNGRIFNIDDGLMPEAAVSMSGLRFINSSSGAEGGAIFNSEQLSIDSCEFENNATTSQGGAVFNNGTITEITQSTFGMNSADGDGGAIANDGTITEIADTIFSGNMASQDGSAIYNNEGSTIEEITNCMFNGNMTATAIFNNEDAVITTITQSTFTLNSGSAGGAIQNDGGMIDRILDSTFSGNSAFDFGGAIYNAVSPGTINDIINCTFVGNMANVGGAIANFSGAMSISFSTIVNNIVEAPPNPMFPANGGGIAHSLANTTVINSIVANNTVNDCFIEMGTFTSLGGNLDSDGTCPGFTQVIPATDLNLDPAGLQDNGGPTDTIALCTEAGMPAGCAGASVALDAIMPVDCTDVESVLVTTDQRLFPRPSGPGCDIGAFEAQFTGTLTIRKETLPEGGMDFDFQGENFPGGCGLDGNFTLDDNQEISCILPEGLYTVDEVGTPSDFGLGNISCTESPVSQSSTGVTIDIGAGDEVTCTFTNLELFITLEPLAGTSDVFTAYTVTATVVRSGEPVEGVEVKFEVIGGPNKGQMSDPGSGECTQNDDCTTDSNGEVSWTYIGEDRGTDTIIASFFDEEFQITVQSNTVVKTWTSIPRNIPTMSEWGLMVTAAVLGLIGLITILKRKALVNNT